MWNPSADERPAEAAAEYVLLSDVRYARRPSVGRRRFETTPDEIVDPWSYAAKTGRGRIRLAPVEYRILQFLASRPNRAFSRQRIAKAVSTRSQRITPESLSRYIHSLRAQLGFFSDYIQSVPYIGYRFSG